jgi:hypothetical protein
MTLAQDIKKIIDKGVLQAYTTVNTIAALTVATSGSLFVWFKDSLNSERIQFQI